MSLIELKNICKNYQMDKVVVKAVDEASFKIEQKGEKVAIIALGDFFQKGEAVASAIKEKCGFAPTLINPRFASGLDEELLHGLEKNHQLVLTLEDGILEGGFGQKFASFYGPDKMLVKITV